MDLEFSNNFCRLCLSSDTIVSIFTEEQTILNMINSLCMITVKENDGLPRGICIECIRTLQTFNDFRQKCIETEKILQGANDIVKTEGTIEIVPIVDGICPEGTIITDNLGDFIADCHYESDQSADWFEKYFEENDLKNSKYCQQNTTKCERNTEEYVRTICHMCGNSVKRERLKQHLLCHSVERQFSCDKCDKKFKEKYKLKIHMMIHNEKYITCNICKKSVTSTYLATHVKFVHSDNKKLKCTICNKSYRNEQLLRCHKRRHVKSLLKSYKCQYCDSMFAESTSAKEHERLHTGETPYKCPSCPKAYAQLGNMKSHFKHNHKDIVFSEVYKPMSKPKRKTIQIL